MENIFPRICFSLRIKHFLQIKKFSPRKKKKSLRLKFKRKIIETVFCINIQIFIGGQNQPLYNWYQLQRKIKRVYMHGLCCIWTFNFGHGTISRLMGETVTQDVCARFMRKYWKPGHTEYVTSYTYRYSVRKPPTDGFTMPGTGHRTNTSKGISVQICLVCTFPKNLDTGLGFHVYICWHV